MKNKELDVSNINTLLQLFSELSKEEKQKFLASLSVKVPQVSTFTPETKEEYLAILILSKTVLTKASKDIYAKAVKRLFV